MPGGYAGVEDLAKSKRNKLGASFVQVSPLSPRHCPPGRSRLLARKRENQIRRAATGRRAVTFDDDGGPSRANGVR